MKAIKNKNLRGLTLVEVMVAIAILAILAMIAAPSFSEYLARKKIEAAASELFADFQYARSEAVSRNTMVRIHFTTEGYKIKVESGVVSSNSCTPTGSTATIKTIVLTKGELTEKDGNTLLECIAFEPVRGSAPVHGSVDVWLAEINARIRLSVTRGGRAQICSPAGSTIKRYNTCL